MLSVIVTAPKRLKMPPPSWSAELPLIVLPVTVKLLDCAEAEDAAAVAVGRVAADRAAGRPSGCYIARRRCRRRRAGRVEADRAVGDRQLASRPVNTAAVRADRELLLIVLPVTVRLPTPLKMPPPPP